MSAERLVLSDKYKAFLQCNAPAEFLEGTTAAGKTTVGLFKFMLKVAESPKKLHILAADDTGAAEKNIINKDLGILDDFGVLVEYKGNGSGEYKMPHILFHTSGGDKIIFVVGYGNKRKWKDALGGQYGCLYIDEINTADIDFVREASMRCDYLMATLNPDDPSLDVYKEYINCSRPLPEWESETPQEIKDELKEEPKPSWVHWFFSFDDNAGLPEEKAPTRSPSKPQIRPAIYHPQKRTSIRSPKAATSRISADGYRRTSGNTNGGQPNNPKYTAVSSFRSSSTLRDAWAISATQNRKPRIFGRGCPRTGTLPSLKIGAPPDKGREGQPPVKYTMPFDSRP